MTKAAMPLRKTEHTARKAVAQPWMEQLARLGYIVRGVIYFLVGVFALQLALGHGSTPPNQTNVIEWLGANPQGHIILILVALGLLGFTLWGFIRAIFDPLHRGDDAEGLAARLGFVASGLGYGTLFLATVQYLQGSVMSSGSPNEWSAKLLAQPWGRIAVGVIGLGWLIGGGLWQIYTAWKTDFVRDFKMHKLSHEEKRMVIWSGRIGMTARGIVFGLVGLFLVLAAIRQNAGEAKGLEGAFYALAQQPYGTILLGVVALGLMVFGVYSILSAFWIKAEVKAKAN